MILKASQRGNARELAKHLLNGHDNEHIEVHAINGFMTDNVEGALQDVNQDSNRVSHWRFIQSTAFKMLSNLFLIHRSSSGAIIKSINQYSGYQKTINMLLWCKQHLFVTLLAAGSNKTLNVDCQSDAVFLTVHCAAN